MEPLIMMLIIMAISALFSKNKKADKTQQTKRQQVPGAQRSAQQAQAPKGGQRSFKRIEDYAKEIYNEMQAQVGDDPKRAQQTRQVKEQAERVKTRAVEEVEKRTQAQAKQVAESKGRPGRLSVHKEEPLKRAFEETKERDLLPLEEEDVRKGIIMAEILLPPKSKRQRQGRHV